MTTERLLIPVDNVSLSVQVAGSGPPLLLVHAYPLCAELWDAQIREFASAYRVIAPDLRGFGASGVPLTADAVPMERYADDLAAVLDRMGLAEPVRYVGVSMGGYIGWEFCRRHPGRVAALAAVCTTPFADDDAGRAKREAIAAAVLENAAATTEALPKSLVGRSTRGERPEVLSKLRRWIDQTDPVAIAAAQRGMASRQSQSNWLAATDLPVLATAGEEDTFVRSDVVRDWSATIRNGQFVEIAASGHLPMLEQPAEFNATLRSFLETIDGRGPA